MIKNANKRQLYIPEAPETSKYKKRSRSTGLSRSKHKHEYKTVLLTNVWNQSKPHEQEQRVFSYESATKVCTICGMIGEVDLDFYEQGTKGAFLNSSRLKDCAYALEKYITVSDNLGEKFAERI